VRSVAPPRGPEWLLETFLPESLRDAVLGDLHEEFVLHVRPSRGPWRAWCWYVGQVLDSLVPALALWVGRGYAWRILRAVGFGLGVGAGSVAALQWVGDFSRRNVPLRAGLTPDTAYLLLTLALGGLAVAVAVGSVVERRAAAAIQVLLSALLAPLAVTLVLDVSPATFPLWYRLAWMLVAPAAATLGGGISVARRRAGPSLSDE
jgi:hypothetical protein